MIQVFVISRARGWSVEMILPESWDHVPASKVTKRLKSMGLYAVTAKGAVFINADLS